MDGLFYWMEFRSISKTTLLSNSIILPHLKSRVEGSLGALLNIGIAALSCLLLLPLSG